MRGGHKSVTYGNEKKLEGDIIDNNDYINDKEDDFINNNKEELNN
jgi:hypothetical protein